MEQRGDLERQLRRCLSDQAVRVRPSGTDLAGHAARTGRRRRLVNHVAGAVVVLAATGLATGGVQLTWSQPASPQLWAEQMEPRPVSPYLAVPRRAVRPEAEPQPAPPTTPPEWVADAPVALVGTDDEGWAVLATGDGDGVGLGYLTGVTAAHEQADGWAVVAERNGQPSLWWVADQSQPLLLLGNLDALAVDRSQLAWRRGPVLTVGELAGGQVATEVEVELAAPEADPVGFAGDTVVLASADGAARAAWLPGTDAPELVWDADVRAVFGRHSPSPDATLGLAQVGDQVCLVRLAVDDRFTVAAAACLPSEPLPDQPAAVSPNGQWLLAVAHDQQAEPVPVLIDVAAAFDGAQSAAEVVAGPVPAGQPVWPDSDAVLYPVPGGVAKVWPQRVLAGAANAVETYAIPGEPPVLAHAVV